MAKLFFTEKPKLIVIVMVAHVATYVLCGLIFMNLFNYEDYIEIIGFRPIEEIRFSTVLLAQMIRGTLIGIVIWWIRDSIFSKKLAWLKLWTILVILSIISTYEPARFSIEGFIYLAPIGELPRSIQWSVIEILVQPLLFSIVVTFRR